MAKNTTYIPATPRSKVFKYYQNINVGSGGGGTSIASPPSILEGEQGYSILNIIGTGNVVASIAENPDDVSTLDVTMGTGAFYVKTLYNTRVITIPVYSYSTLVNIPFSDIGFNPIGCVCSIIDPATQGNVTPEMTASSILLPNALSIVISNPYGDAYTFQIGDIGVSIFVF